MPPKEHKVTRREFERFKDAFRRHQDEMGLHRYRIIFKMVDDPKNYAAVTADHDAVAATVELCKVVEPEHMDGWNPEELAKHECLHLLLAKLAGMAHQRFVSYDELEREEESVVQTLAKLIP